MQRLIWSDLSAEAQDAALARPAAINDPALYARVREIMDAVKRGGDKPVLDYTQRFDGAALGDLRVPYSKLKDAWADLEENAKDAIRTAKANIETFHTAQLPQPITVETMPGVSCSRLPRAIGSAGLYVPGGTAPLVSTLLMLAVPAKVAGVPKRVIVTPPNQHGEVNPAILAAAYYCGISEVYMCGGAQAIAALAYGTETIPKCDKIFGPGNAYVAAAKAMAAMEPSGPAIDLPAGPSEAMVLADEAAHPAFVASDLLSQAEHDTLAQVMLVSTSDLMLKRVQGEVETQLKALTREDIAREAMGNAKFILASTREDVTQIVNTYAPEHLIIQMEEAESYVSLVQNAGSIFLGPWTPESIGDYASGTNHTLPTAGAAKAYSGVTTESFMKYISVQSLTADGLQRLGPTVERLAELEGLGAHKYAVTLRLESLK